MVMKVSVVDDACLAPKWGYQPLSEGSTFTPSLEHVQHSLWYVWAHPRPVCVGVWVRAPHPYSSTAATIVFDTFDGIINVTSDHGDANSGGHPAAILP